MITVTLKTGKEISVLPREVKGLKAAGLLKEEKGKTKTKEEKETGSTKEDAGTKSEPPKKAPEPNRPVNISHKNIKKG